MSKVSLLAILLVFLAASATSAPAQRLGSIQLCHKFVIPSNDNLRAILCQSKDVCGGPKIQVPTSFLASTWCNEGQEQDCEPLPDGLASCQVWIQPTDPTPMACPMLCPGLPTVNTQPVGLLSANDHEVVASNLAEPRTGIMSISLVQLSHAELAALGDWQTFNNEGIKLRSKRRPVSRMMQETQTTGTILNSTVVTLGNTTVDNVVTVINFKRNTQHTSPENMAWVAPVISFAWALAAIIVYLLFRNRRSDPIVTFQMHDKAELATENNQAADEPVMFGNPSSKLADSDKLEDSDDLIPVPSLLPVIDTAVAGHIHLFGAPKTVIMAGRKPDPHEQLQATEGFMFGLPPTRTASRQAVHSHSGSPAPRSPLGSSSCTPAVQGRPSTDPFATDVERGQESPTHSSRSGVWDTLRASMRSHRVAPLSSDEQTVCSPRSPGRSLDSKASASAFLSARMGRSGSNRVSPEPLSPTQTDRSRAKSLAGGHVPVSPVAPRSFGTDHGGYQAMPKPQWSALRPSEFHRVSHREDDEIAPDLGAMEAASQHGSLEPLPAPVQAVQSSSGREQQPRQLPAALFPDGQQSGQPGLAGLPQWSKLRASTYEPSKTSSSGRASTNPMASGASSSQGAKPVEISKPQWGTLRASVVVPPIQQDVEQSQVMSSGAQSSSTEVQRNNTAPNKHKSTVQPSHHSDSQVLTSGKDLHGTQLVDSADGIPQLKQVQKSINSNKERSQSMAAITSGVTHNSQVSGETATASQPSRPSSGVARKQQRMQPQDGPQGSNVLMAGAVKTGHKQQKHVPASHPATDALQPTSQSATRTTGSNIPALEAFNCDMQRTSPVPAPRKSVLHCHNWTLPDDHEDNCEEIQLTNAMPGDQNLPNAIPSPSAAVAKRKLAPRSGSRLDISVEDGNSPTTSPTAPDTSTQAPAVQERLFQPPQPHQKQEIKPSLEKPEMVATIPQPRKKGLSSLLPAHTLPPPLPPPAGRRASLTAILNAPVVTPLAEMLHAPSQPPPDGVSMVMGLPMRASKSTVPGEPPKGLSSLLKDQQPQKKPAEQAVRVPGEEEDESVPFAQQLPSRRHQTTSKTVPTSRQQGLNSLPATLPQSSTGDPSQKPLSKTPKHSLPINVEPLKQPVNKGKPAENGEGLKHAW